MDIKKLYFQSKMDEEGLDKQPELWISKIFMIQDDDFWKGKYEGTEIFKTIKEFMSKDELTELIKLEWLVYLFPNVRKFLTRALSNNDLIFSTKNDKSMPDVKVDKEWYEFCFGSVEIFNHADGHDFEVAIIDQQDKKGIEEVLNDESSLHFGDGNIPFVPEEMAKVKYKKIAKQISKKNKKNYKVAEPANLVIFTERNLNHDIFMQPLGVKYLFENHSELMLEAVEKFKKIYICTEDKVSNDIFLNANKKTKVENAIGFYIDKNNIKLFMSLDINGLFSLFYKQKQDFIRIAAKK